MSSLAYSRHEDVNFRNPNSWSAIPKLARNDTIQQRIKITQLRTGTRSQRWTSRPCGILSRSMHRAHASVELRLEGPELSLGLAGLRLLQIDGVPACSLPQLMSRSRIAQFMNAL